MLLGCIADDLTGATDLALTLTRGGLRTVQLIWRRQGSFPLALAVAAWVAGAAYLLINALVQVTAFPVLAIMSFAPVYPLVLIFIAAVFWDVGGA